MHATPTDQAALHLRHFAAVANADELVKRAREAEGFDGHMRAFESAKELFALWPSDEVRAARDAAWRAAMSGAFPGRETQPSISDEFLDSIARRRAA
jgi:hypothetical protein